MTLVSEIISDAFRQSNLTSIGNAPTSAQETEALRYLNRLVKSVFGYEAGDEFTSMAIGKSNISRPSGYPYYNEAPYEDWFVPENTRLVFNLDEALSVFLTPDPDDGARFSVVDASSNLSTYNVTINGNGRTIEGATSVVLNTNSYKGDWFYRADTGNWVLYSNLATTDTFPFPEEFDDFFITMLALRINPSYGVSMDPQTQSIFQRSRAQLRARYKIDKPIGTELALVRTNSNWDMVLSYGDDETLFKKGIVY